MRKTRFNKTAIVVCVVAGFVVALMTRMSIVVATTDLSYVRIAPMDFHEPLRSVLYGKRVIGIGGFPFSTFSDCMMGYHGEMTSPACDAFSIFWEFSVVLNALFWACILYGIFLLIPSSSATGDTNTRWAGRS
jgi:hypothetical protein